MMHIITIIIIIILNSFKILRYDFYVPDFRQMHLHLPQKGVDILMSQETKYFV